MAMPLMRIDHESNGRLEFPNLSSLKLLDPDQKLERKERKKEHPEWSWIIRVV